MFLRGSPNRWVDRGNHARTLARPCSSGRRPGREPSYLSRRRGRTETGPGPEPDAPRPARGFLYPGSHRSIRQQRPRERAKRTGQENGPRERGRVIEMRYECERGGRTVANVLWEGPGQVTVDVTDAADRPQFDRFFGEEVAYLDAGFDFGGGMDDAGMTTRRRDWTPWEFERATRNLAHRLGCTVRRVETGPVEERLERRAEVAAT